MIVVSSILQRLFKMNVFIPLFSTSLFIQIVTSCVWNLNTDIPRNDPVYMLTSEKPALMIPGSDGLMLNTGNSIKFVCPEKSNFISGTKQRELTATCTKDNKLSYNNIVSPLNSFECEHPATSELVYTKASCGNGRGEIFEIGFNSTSGLAPLFYVCYDKMRESVLFSMHDLYGNALKAAEIDSERPAFRTPGLTYGTTTANHYKQTDQKQRFSSLLGETQTDKYITKNSFLSRGHLAPDADFVIGTWSAATYFYVNVAPEWQVVNAGNWLKVEDLTRDIAMKRKETLTIYTGIYGVLQLPDSTGKLVDIYLLTEKRLPVPKFYWKIIYSEATAEAIAFVTLNNPHTDEIDPDDIFCQNICKETKWDRKEWTKFDKGFTFCCAANELLNVVGTVPLLSIKRNMTGPAL